MTSRFHNIDDDLEEALRFFALDPADRDPEKLRRFRERADQIRDEIRATYGVRVLAVELIRETRDNR